MSTSYRQYFTLDKGTLWVNEHNIAYVKMDDNHEEYTYIMLTDGTHFTVPERVAVVMDELMGED